MVMCGLIALPRSARCNPLCAPSLISVTSKAGCAWGNSVLRPLYLAAVITAKPSVVRTEEINALSASSGSTTNAPGRGDCEVFTLLRGIRALSRLFWGSISDQIVHVLVDFNLQTQDSRTTRDVVSQREE